MIFYHIFKIKMYFEKSYKINDNGKVSGLHQRGKYEDDGSITYFVNDKYGDEEVLKKIPLNDNDKQPCHNPFSLFVNDFTVNPFLPPSPHVPTYMNPKYFHVPKHRQITDDNEFINFCEQKQQKPKKELTAEQAKNIHQSIKRAIREEINKQLDLLGFAQTETLDDFNGLVGFFIDDGLF